MTIKSTGFGVSITMKHLAPVFACLLLVVSCGQTEGAQSSGNTTPKSTTTIQATGFLTQNTEAPDGAADTRGDGVMRDSDGRPFEYALLGQKLPAFTARMADNSTFDSTLINRWTVIDVWGAWCGDCVADGPYVEALSRAIAADTDLDFVSIHVPASAARATPDQMFGKYGSLNAYFESAGYTLPVVLDTDGSLRELLKISWTPTYLVVSPDGIVRGFRTDLSVDRDQPVKSFMKDIARVRGEVRTSLLPTISATGAMGLAGPTPFTLPAIEAAFPGLVVTPQVESVGSDVPVFHVSAPDAAAPRYVIEPDWSRGFVGRVRTSDPAVEGPNGLRTGQSRYSDLRQEAVVGCVPTGAGSDLKITCQSSNSLPSLQLDFKADGGGAPMLVEMSYLAAIPVP